MGWMILVKDHLPYSPDARAHDIRPISWELLWNTVRDSLEDTTNALGSNAALLTEGVDYERVWHSMKLGPTQWPLKGSSCTG